MSVLFNVKPALDFHLLGTGLRLDSAKTYVATAATNQPDFTARKLVFLFCDNRGNPAPAGDNSPSFLLGDGDYTAA